MRDLKGEIQAHIRSLEQRLAQLMERESRFGSDMDWDVGHVFVFEKVYAHRPQRSWKYAALKAAPNRWYTTGSGSYPNQFDWESLLNFMSDGVTEVWSSTGWEEI